LDSNNDVYWGRLGEVCRKLNRLDKAEEAYKHAVQANNQNSEYWLLWGLTMLVQERYEDAEKPLRHALEMDKTDSAKWNAYINSLQKQKKYKEAANQLEEFLAQPGNEKMVKTWAFLGGVLIEDGQYNKAKITLEKSKSLSKDPQEIAGIDKMLAELKKRQGTKS
jgi:tetratricopeptide (TPR) repeat protein